MRTEHLHALPHGQCRRACWNLLFLGILPMCCNATNLASWLDAAALDPFAAGETGRLCDLAPITCCAAIGPPAGQQLGWVHWVTPEPGSAQDTAAGWAAGSVWHIEACSLLEQPVSVDLTAVRTLPLHEVPQPPLSLQWLTFGNQTGAHCLPRSPVLSHCKACCPRTFVNVCCLMHLASE